MKCTSCSRQTTAKSGLCRECNRYWEELRCEEDRHDWIDRFDRRSLGKYSRDEDVIRDVEDAIEEMLG